jgi:probable HAF family extracellular repeat protein
MWFRTLFASLKPERSRRPVQQARRGDPRLRRPSCLSIEVLEDRWLPSASVIDLGWLPGSEGSEAADINASAQVVGTSGTNSGPMHGFLWQNGVMTDLGTLGGSYSSALAINDAGQVVGKSSVSPTSADAHAFLITPEDTNGNGIPDRWYRDTNGDGRNDLMRDLGTLGGRSSSAADVNSAGQVVGTAAIASGSDHAFLWQYGQMRDLGTLSGQTSAANGINNSGQVTGTAVAADGWSHAFLWQGGVMTDLGRASSSNDINSAGQVAGSRLWTPATPNGTSGTFTDLGTLPPLDTLSLQSGSVALGINSATQVVGYSCEWFPDGWGGGFDVFRAFAWQDGVMQDLNDQSPNLWLLKATAVNDAGQIVGVAGDPSGGYYGMGSNSAFLWTSVSLALPRVSVSNAAVIEGNAGTTDAVFTVSLSEASTQTVTVAYWTWDGTATAGSDYLASSGTLTFAPGQVSQTITVPVLGDRNPEPEVFGENFSVFLSNQTNAILAGNWGTGTIYDDEPRVLGNSVTVLEGNSGTTTALVTLIMSTAYDQDVTVAYATAGGSAAAGSDFLPLSGTVTFTPGQTMRQIPVTVLGDRITELYLDYNGGWYNTEYFTIDLSVLSGNATAMGGGGVTIQDDEPLTTISPEPVTVTEGDAGTTDAVFKVRLSAPYDQDITVDYFTSDAFDAYPYNDSATAGSDYVATSGTLRIAAGQTSGTITVLVIGDVLPERPEYFYLWLGNSSGNTGIAFGQGVGEILDDEPPALSVNDLTWQEGNNGTTSLFFTVTLSFASSQTVTVNFVTANGSATAGSDYLAKSGTLTFAPGETSKTVSVLVNGDRLAEPNETFFVNLSGATNATIADGQGVGIILDDEPRISISDVSKYEGKRGRTTLFVFTVTLSAAYDQPVTMSFRTVDGTAKTSDQDYIAKTGTLTFAPGETTKTITIVVNGDSKREANETFFLDLFGNSSNSLLTKSRGIGTILNDD